LGIPNGWLVTIYDFQSHEWIEKGGSLHSTLGDAKAGAHVKVTPLLGKKVSEMKWY